MRQPLLGLFLLAATGVLVPGMALSQGLTGTLIGTVKDEQGGSLPGALVTVSSRALIGGPLTAPTNEKADLAIERHLQQRVGVRLRR